MTASSDITADAASAPDGAGRARGRTNKGALDSLTIRQRTTGADAAARAQFMRRMRVALHAYIAGQPRIWEVIVTGGDPPDVFYYTDDHYRTFRQIEASALGKLKKALLERVGDPVEAGLIAA